MAERGTWRDRLLAGMGAAAVATLFYRGLQAATAYRAVLREECWAWTWLPFDEGWLGWYLSMFLLVGLPWFLLPTWSQVVRYGQCLLGMAAVGWITFLLYPTACARPDAAGHSWAYVLLLKLDGANNCLPCLHSAMAVLAVGALWPAVGTKGAGLIRAGLLAWTTLIGVSIVALRQHTDWDTLVGVLLGLAATLGYRWSLRNKT